MDWLKVAAQLGGVHDTVPPLMRHEPCQKTSCGGSVSAGFKDTERVPNGVSCLAEPAFGGLVQTLIRGYFLPYYMSGESVGLYSHVEYNLGIDLTWKAKPLQT